MSQTSEDVLEEGCARGDSAALHEAVELLGSDHPYTRARASEMLALAPEGALVPLVKRTFAEGFPDALWWRVLCLFAERHGGPPGGASTGERMREALEECARPPADAVFHALRALAAAGVPGRGKAAERWVADADDEVAFRAALCVADERPLTDQEMVRMAAIRGPDRLHALVLRLEQGELDVAPMLVRAIPRAGPFAYHVLDALESHADGRAIPDLARLYKRRLSGQHVSARAAGCAAKLGDSAAVERLRAFTKAWRRDVRAVAWAELARVGAPEDWAAIRALIDANDPSAAFIVAELWRGPEEVWRDDVLAALAGGDEELRVAACESAAHWLGAEAVAAALRSASEDPTPRVRDAARAALDPQRP